MKKKNKKIVVNADYKMKVINFLKIYGYYKGILTKMDVERKYLSGALGLINIIETKEDYKELKMSIKVVIRYCKDNNYFDMLRIMEHFYKVECLEIKNKFGSFWDKF